MPKMFAIPNCNSIGIQLLCVIAIGITEVPVSEGNILYNETCVNVSSEIVCYFKGSEKQVTWNESWQLCSSFSATLPVIRNKNEQDAVANYINSDVKNSGEAWTAGKRFTYSNWTWISGAELNESVQVYAAQLQENETIDGERDYAAFDSDFNFTALAASEEMHYICQYEGENCNSSCETTATNICLRLINDRRTWYDARDQCLMSHGDLAIIGDKDHESLKTMTPNQRYWIGLRKSSWRWIRNDKADSTDEIENVKFQYVKSRECITFDASGNKWTAVECTRPRGVVCQRGQGVTSLADTADASTESTNTFIMFAVVGVVVILICIIIVIIVFVLKMKKGNNHQSKCNQSSEENNHETVYSNVSNAQTYTSANEPSSTDRSDTGVETLYSNVSYTAVHTFSNEPANAVVDRSDTGVEYAEIELLTPEELEDGEAAQPPGISYTSLAAKEQMEAGEAKRQPRTTYFSLESKEDPEYMEVVQNKAHSRASRKVGPLGDMYAMPECKGQAVTSPSVEAASKPVKVIPRGETVYANLQTDLPGY